MSTYSGSGIVTGANLIADYTYGLGLTSQVTASGSTYCYDFDALGDTVALTNSSGSMVNRYSYLPFGGSLSSSVTTANPFQFVGRLGAESVIADPKIVFMRTRYYASDTGQFVSNDPLGLLGGDINTRRYSNNNPVTFLDPVGLGYFETNGNPGNEGNTGHIRYRFTSGPYAGETIGFTQYGKNWWNVFYTNGFYETLPGSYQKNQYHQIGGFYDDTKMEFIANNYQPKLYMVVGYNCWNWAVDIQQIYIHEGGVVSPTVPSRTLIPSTQKARLP